MKHNGASYARCGSCGLLYVNPRSDSRQIESFYQRDYYDLAIKKVEFASRIEFFQQVCAKIETKVGLGRLLDVGCGYGHFLEICRGRGWQVSGVELAHEPSSQAKASGLDVFYGTLAAAAYPESSFSAVTLWNVLDHFMEPLADMREVYRVLRPGGVVCIRVPNAAFHLGAKRLIRLANRVPGTRIADVTTFKTTCFTARTLERFLVRTGFTDIAVENGTMSDINPWSIDRQYRAGLIKLLRLFVRSSFTAISAVSLGKVKLAPAIEAYASK